MVGGFHRVLDLTAVGSLGLFADWQAWSEGKPLGTTVCDLPHNLRTLNDNNMAEEIVASQLSSLFCPALGYSKHSKWSC